MEVDITPSTSNDSKKIPTEKKLPNRAQLLHKFQFAEMNLKHTGNAERTLNLVKRAIRMGYDSIVINIDVGDPFQSAEKVGMETDQPPPKKKKKKGQTKARTVEVIPDPFLVDETKLNLGDFEISGKKFRQFSRLTVTISDSTSVHALMHHPKTKLYDLLAVRVEDEDLLTTFSTKGDFLDIITFDPTSGKIPWLFKRKIIQRCIENGIGFELTYGDALANKNERRQFITNARLLMRSSRNGRSVFIASGTDEMICIRAPFDTANMSVLFGINQKDARKFVSANPKQILLRSQAKKTIKGAVMVSDLSHVPSADNSSKEALKDLAAVPEFKRQMNLAEEVEENIDEDDGILAIF